MWSQDSVTCRLTGSLTIVLSSHVAFSVPQAFLNLAFLFQIPVIAVMATGGGIRAMTSLYGQLAGLKELGLLDCVSYITGASGSTW